MNKIVVVRALAISAAACTWSVQARGQQILPLDVPEAAALHAALRDNPQLASVQLRVRGAEARIRSARALRNPAALFFEAEEISTAGPATANVTLGVAHEFTPSGERRGEVAIALADLSVASAIRDGVQLALESRLTRVFLEAVVQSRIMARLAAEDTLLRRAESTLNARFAVGEARYIDVIRLRTERLRIQADQLQANTHFSRALLEVRSLTGRELPGLDFKAVAIRLPRLPADIDSVIAHAPAARIAAAEQERARASLLATSARRSARFTGQIGFQRFNDDSGSTIGPTVGASISLPFTNRRSVQPKLEAARADSAAAGLALLATRTSLRGEVAAVLEQIRATAQRISGVDQLLISAAREEREAALSAYANGELSLVELLDFERSLSRSEVQLLQSYDAAIAAWDQANRLLAGVSTITGDPE